MSAVQSALIVDTANYRTVVIALRHFVSVLHDEPCVTSCVTRVRCFAVGSISVLGTRGVNASGGP